MFNYTIYVVFFLHFYLCDHICSVFFFKLSVPCIHTNIYNVKSLVSYCMWLGEILE